MSSKIKYKLLEENISREKSGPDKEAQADLKARMFDAKLALAKRLGHDPTLEEIAQLFSDYGGGAPPAASVVRGWLEGRPPRGLVPQRVLAAVFDVDPGWLYFGYASLAPAPGLDGLRAALAAIEGRVIEEAKGDPARTNLPEPPVRRLPRPWDDGDNPPKGKGR